MSGGLARLTELARRARVRASRVQTEAVRLLRKHLPLESQHLFAVTIVTGLVCGLLAVGFHLAIQGAEAMLIDRAMHATGNTWRAWTVLSPTLGGLGAGLLLAVVVPGARGSGIPQVKAAFALEGGRVRFRDAFGKFWLAAAQIGSGASLGREGPTVQICAGATTLLARVTALPARSARRLLPVGVAAGIAAAFNAPIAAVTFTIEEVVGSLDSAVLSGVVVAAALAAVIERRVLGAHPIIEVQQQYGLDHPSSLLLYAILGIAGGLVSVAFTDGLLGLRRAFRDQALVPGWAQPAVGGLVTGVLAVVLLETLGTEGVTGGGYGTLGKALAGQLGLKVLLALLVAKGVATVFSYSSGGAGGIFAPSLFVGAMLGGAFGYLDVALLDHEPRQLGAFALVGMGAVFAGVIRAPITSVLIIFEMTGGYGLVLPLMLANMSAYALARRLRPAPIYEALLEQDGIVLPHAASVPHPLERLRVRDAMTSAVLGVPLSATAGEARAQLEGRAFELAPVTDPSGGLQGTVLLSRLRSAAADTPVAALRASAETILANEPLDRAVVRMGDPGARHLVVLDGSTAASVVGILTISDLVRAHARVVGAAPRSLPGPVAARSHQAERLVARELARPAPALTPDAPLDEVVAALASSASGAVLVQGPGGPLLGVVTLDELREFLGDEPLRRVLVAVDLARPGPRAGPETGLAELVRLTAGASAVLIEPSEGLPEVITRTQLGELLLERLEPDGAWPPAGAHPGTPPGPG